MEELNSSVYDYIAGVVDKENIFLNEPMSRHTTFKVGGNAKALVIIRKEEELTDLIPYLIRMQEPYYIKGNGSNILVGDKGYNGVILDLSTGFNNIECTGNIIRCEAGAFMSSIARVCCENSLTGFEFASGIPGTIGGGVVMNAGAYGGELSNVVKSVKVMNPEGEIFNIGKADMEFGYRTSVIKTRPFTVLEVVLELEDGDKDKIKDTMDELNQRRREKQPLEYPSAGSTFKRPEGYFAGKLIMDAGLRGYTIGGAAISEKHCGFVINKGNATAEDVYELITEVQEKVKDRFGVSLEPEIIFLGTF